MKIFLPEDSNNTTTENWQRTQSARNLSKVLTPKTRNSTLRSSGRRKNNNSRKQLHSARLSENLFIKFLLNTFVNMEFDVTFDGYDPRFLLKSLERTNQTATTPTGIPNRSPNIERRHASNSSLNEIVRDKFDPVQLSVHFNKIDGTLYDFEFTYTYDQVTRNSQIEELVQKFATENLIEINHIPKWKANFNLFLDNVAILFPGLKRETLKSFNDLSMDDSLTQLPMVGDLENKLEDILEIRRYSQKVEGADKNMSSDDSIEIEQPKALPDLIKTALEEFNQKNEDNMWKVVEFIENMQKEELNSLRAEIEQLKTKCDEDDDVIKSKMKLNEELKSEEKRLKEAVEKLEENEDSDLGEQVDN